MQILVETGPNENEILTFFCFGIEHGLQRNQNKQKKKGVGGWKGIFLSMDSVGWVSTVHSVCLYKTGETSCWK